MTGSTKQLAKEPPVSGLPPRPRQRGKSLSTQRQLIEATIEAIAAGGLHEATLSVVSDLSGLSRGLVGYHFRSKDEMLKQTLAYLSDEYRAGWQAALNDGKVSPEKRLLNLIEFDLGTVVCSQRRVAVWYAFWGSVRTMALYREVCLPADRDYMQRIADTVRQLRREENLRGIDPRAVARGYSALIIGQWQSFNVAPEDFDRREAKSMSRAFFRSFFPRRFQ